MMNLTIDIGNSNVMMCFFDNNKLLNYLHVDVSEFNKFNVIRFINENCINLQKLNVIISSVVPKIKKDFIEIFNKKKIKYFFVKDLIKSFNLKIKLINKKEIGDDRLVNVLYAKQMYIKSTMIIDFGTATTIDVLDKNGDYDGGVITPGIDLSLKSLKSGTAKLPLVDFKKTKFVVGKSTINAIKSGFYWGYRSMISGLIEKIQFEQNDTFKIIVTGGNSKYFNNCFENVIKIDEFFNTRGLNFLINYYLKSYKK